MLDQEIEFPENNLKVWELTAAHERCKKKGNIIFQARDIHVGGRARERDEKNEADGGARRQPAEFRRGVRGSAAR